MPDGVMWRGPLGRGENLLDEGYDVPVELGALTPEPFQQLHQLFGHSCSFSPPERPVPSPK